MATKKQIVSQIRELEGQQIQWENKREEYSDKANEAKFNAERYWTEARQLSGVEKNKAEQAYEKTMIGYHSDMANYKNARDQVDIIQGEIEDLKAEVNGREPDKGMPHEKMTPEKAKELADDKASKGRDGKDDLGGDFEDM